jgi:hypothetical protein
MQSGLLMDPLKEKLKAPGPMTLHDGVEADRGDRIGLHGYSIRMVIENSFKLLSRLLSRSAADMLGICRSRCKGG